MAAAPIVSLSVVPWARGRGLRAPEPVTRAEDAAVLEGAAEANPGREPALQGDASGITPRGTSADADFTLSHGSGFAVAVLLIMLSEQSFLNAGPLLVKATEGAGGAALAGFTF